MNVCPGQPEHLYGIRCKTKFPAPTQSGRAFVKFFAIELMLFALIVIGAEPYKYAL